MHSSVYWQLSSRPWLQLSDQGQPSAATHIYKTRQQQVYEIFPPRYRCIDKSCRNHILVFFLVRMWRRGIKCSRPIFSGSKLWRLVWFVRSVFYNRNHQTLWSPGACVPSLIHRHVASVNWQLTGGVTSTISVTSTIGVTSELYLSSEILYRID